MLMIITHKLTITKTYADELYLPHSVEFVESEWRGEYGLVEGLVHFHKKGSHCWV